MEFFDVVETRQSVRSYASTAIPREKLEAILNAANRAPSAGNYQSFEIYLVDTPDKIARLTRATFNQDFIAQAPLALVFCADPSRCQYQPPELYALEDATIACTFATLAITALGLSTCWIGAFKPETVADVIACGNQQTPVAILPIGYPAETPARTTRRPLSDLVHHV